MRKLKHIWKSHSCIRYRIGRAGWGVFLGRNVHRWRRTGLVIFNLKALGGGLRRSGRPLPH